MRPVGVRRLTAPGSADGPLAQRCDHASPHPPLRGYFPHKGGRARRFGQVTSSPFHGGGGRECGRWGCTRLTAPGSADGPLAQHCDHASPHPPLRGYFPHKGGGNHKTLCTSKVLMTQWYRSWPDALFKSSDEVPPLTQRRTS